MHELYLARVLLDEVEKIAREQEAKGIRVAHLRVGALAGVQVESLRFGFEALSKEGLARGCDLRVEQDPARGQCSRCSWSGELDDQLDLTCKACGEFPVRLSGSREIVLTSVELEAEQG